MPRPRSNTPLSLSPGQAQYVLQMLVNDRRISVAEVNRYVSAMHREISDLEQRLQSLRSAAADVIAAATGWKRGPGRPPKSASQGAAPAPSKAGGKRRRRSSALTPEQRASRQLQGRYLGLIRQIPASRRPQYARIAKEKGREAAIKEMQSNLNK